jgi:hypothetical protein
MRRVAVACSSAGAGGSGVEGDEEGMTYKGAGVDIDAGTELVRRIGRLAPAIGGFGGLFPFGTILLPISLFVLSRLVFFFFLRGSRLGFSLLVINGCVFGRVL